MEKEILIINAETIQKIRDGLKNSFSRQHAIDDIRKMIEIKEGHLWRTDVMSPCCGSFSGPNGIECLIGCELDMLRRSLEAAERNDFNGADKALVEYGEHLARCTGNGRY